MEARCRAKEPCKSGAEHEGRKRHSILSRSRAHARYPTPAVVGRASVRPASLGASGAWCSRGTRSRWRTQRKVSSALRDHPTVAALSRFRGSGAARLGAMCPRGSQEGRRTQPRFSRGDLARAQACESPRLLQAVMVDPPRSPRRRGNPKKCTASMESCPRRRAWGACGRRWECRGQRKVEGLALETTRRRQEGRWMRLLGQTHQREHEQQQEERDGEEEEEEKSER